MALTTHGEHADGWIPPQQTEEEVREWARDYGFNDSWYWSPKWQTMTSITDGITTVRDVADALARGDDSPEIARLAADYWLMIGRHVQTGAAAAVGAARWAAVEDTTDEDGYYPEPPPAAAARIEAADDDHAAVSAIVEDLAEASRAAWSAETDAQDAAEAAERLDTAEVQKVYNLLYDPARYLDIEGDGQAEDNYVDSTWAAAETHVAGGRTAADLRTERAAARAAGERAQAASEYEGDQRSLWEELGASPPEVRAAFWYARDTSGRGAGDTMSSAEFGGAYEEAGLPVPEDLQHGGAAEVKAVGGLDTAWREGAEVTYTEHIIAYGNDGRIEDDRALPTADAARRDAAIALIVEQTGLRPGFIRQEMREAAYAHGRAPGSEADPDHFAPPDWEHLRDWSPEGYETHDTAAKAPADHYDDHGRRDPEATERADLAHAHAAGLDPAALAPSELVGSNQSDQDYGAEVDGAEVQRVYRYLDNDPYYAAREDSYSDHVSKHAETLVALGYTTANLAELDAETRAATARAQAIDAAHERVTDAASSVGIARAMVTFDSPGALLAAEQAHAEAVAALDALLTDDTDPDPAGWASALAISVPGSVSEQGGAAVTEYVARVAGETSEAGASDIADALDDLADLIDTGLVADPDGEADRAEAAVAAYWAAHPSPESLDQKLDSEFDAVENAAWSIAHAVGDREPDDGAYDLAREALAGKCSLDWVNSVVAVAETERRLASDTARTHRRLDDGQAVMAAEDASRRDFAGSGDEAASEGVERPAPMSAAEVSQRGLWGSVAAVYSEPYGRGDLPVGYRELLEWDAARGEWVEPGDVSNPSAVPGDEEPPGATHELTGCHAAAEAPDDGAEPPGKPGAAEAVATAHAAVQADTRRVVEELDEQQQAAHARGGAELTEAAEQAPTMERGA